MSISRSRALTVLLPVVFGSGLAGLPAQSLLKDLENTPLGRYDGSPTNGVAGTSLHYFRAMVGPFVEEALFRTDGTAEGTWRLEVVDRTTQGFSDVTTSGDLGYYSFSQAFSTTELRLTDGGRGASQVVFVNGSTSRGGPRGRLGRQIVFTGDRGPAGLEPWITDGTAQGTRLLRDIWPGIDDSVSRGDVPDRGDWPELNGSLLFPALDGTRGAELWKTDGTTAGTVLVADLEPGSGSSEPHWFVRGGGFVWFRAATSQHGAELWRTDGTAAGTVRVADIEPGRGSSEPRDLVWSAGKLFFAANPGGRGGGVWSFDPATGVAQQAAPVSARIFPGRAARFVPCAGGVVFAGSDAARGEEPWFTDGTLAGARVLADVAPGAGSSEPRSFHALAGEAWFTASDPAAGRELWRTDGTPAGTSRLLDLNPGTADGVLGIVGVQGTELLLNAVANQFGAELWATDGSVAGTRFVADLYEADRTPSSEPRFWPEGGPVFSADLAGVGREPIWTDGTPQGTRLLADLRAGGSSDPQSIQSFGTESWFSADDGVRGREPYYYDGTALHTFDLVPGALGSGPGNFVPFRGDVYFSATSSRAPTLPVLWRSDRTAAGTRPLAAMQRMFSPPVPLGDVLVFSAADPAFPHDTELWTSDGTLGGTAELIDLWAGGSSSPRELTRAGEQLFFSAFQRSTGWELWVTDGTAAGTRLCRDIAPGSDPRTGVGISSTPQGLTAVGDRVYFFAADPTAGRELWVSDGTTAGTQLVADTVPGPAWPADIALDLVVAGDLLYFMQDDGVHGHELWVSDGTQAGTRMVADVFPGPGDGLRRQPGKIVPFGSGGHVLFEARDASGEREPWISDGTPGGTRRFADLRSGGGSDPAAPGSGGFVVWGRKILFSVEDGRRGREPWIVDVAEPLLPLATSFGSPCGATAFGPEIGSSGEPRVRRVFGVSLRGAAAGRTAFLLWGQEAAYEAFGRCRLLVADPAIYGVAVTDALGAAQQTLLLPNITAVFGLELDFQWAVAEPGGPVGGVVSLSDGLLAVIGL